MSQDQQEKKHFSKPFIQLSQVPKTEGWLINGVITPFDKLSNEQLQQSLIKAEENELKFHNRSSFFGILVEKLSEEGQKRNIELKHLDTQFTESTHGKLK